MIGNHVGKTKFKLFTLICTFFRKLNLCCKWPNVTTFARSRFNYWSKFRISHRPLGSWRSE